MIKLRLPALVALVLVMTAGIAVAAPTSAGRSRGTIVFLGDSNEVVPAQEIDAALLDRNNGYVVVNVSRSGASIRWGGPTNDFWLGRIADTKAAVRPEVWVVNLGINDTAAPGQPTSRGYSSYGTKIDWLLSKFGSAPVIWANLPCKIVPSYRAKGCAAVNNALRAATARHAKLHVLDWASVANGHPEYLGPPSGVHLTAEGRDAWAQLVAKRLDAMFTAP